MAADLANVPIALLVRQRFYCEVLATASRLRLYLLTKSCIQRTVHRCQRTGGDHRDHPRSDVTMAGRGAGPGDGWLDFAQPDLRPEHAEIRELAHEFAERRLRPQAARMDTEEYFPRDLFAAAGEAGLIGIAVPEELGGGGLDLLAAGIVREELARVSPAFAASVVASGMYFGYNIARSGTARQRERWLPAIAAGELIGGGGRTAPQAGSDARAITTTTVRHGDAITVRGSKCFITNAPVADVLIVQTQVKPYAGSPGGYQSVIVERGLPGVSF